jgi:hypothetical protein
MAGDALRVLFCLGVNPAFFDAGPDERQDAFETIKSTFANLGERFGVRVLGTMDDDQTMVGSSSLRRLVGPEAPVVALGVADGEVARAVVLIG